MVSKEEGPLAFANYVETHPLTVTDGDSSLHAVASSLALDEYLTEACDASMPRRKRGPVGKRPVYWWSTEISDLRKNILSSRRSYQRSLRRLGLQSSEAARIQFLAARKILRVAIRKAKDGCWRELYESVEADPWGMPYRIVMKKLGSSAARNAAVGKELVTTSFRPPQ